MHMIEKEPECWRSWRAQELRAMSARAYNGGLGAQAPSGVQGQSPWSGGQGGEAP